MNGRRGKVYIKNKTRHELNYFYHSYSKTITFRQFIFCFMCLKLFFFQIFSKWKVDPIWFDESDPNKSDPMLLSGYHVCIITSLIAHLLCITPTLYQTPFPNITFPDLKSLLVYCAFAHLLFAKLSWESMLKYSAVAPSYNISMRSFPQKGIQHLTF